MTLSEFQHWLTVEISERYHRAFHRGLGATPLGTREHALGQGARYEIPADHIEFERKIARAFRGISEPNFEETLTAAGFLQLLQDRGSFVVELWDVDTTHAVAGSLDQYAALFTHHCSHLFGCRRPRRFSHLRTNQERASLAQIADPATRRAALWLVVRVIRLAPTPRPAHALHLGYTAQDDFFGSRQHAGWRWLAAQAREWPAHSATHFWAGLEGTMTD